MADIRDSLVKILEGGSGMTGAFSYCQKYPVPNPGLCVDGADTIGLPLGLRDAEALKGAAALAEGGHSWVVEAERVHFENTAWSTFVKDVLQKTCDGLGIREEVSKLRCELISVRLSETGSSTLVPFSTEKVVASLAIVLPSKFKGGMVRVTHGDGAENYDCTPGTVTDSTVIAWHRDTIIDAQPIAQGYQLALYYGIVQNTEHPLPTLAAQDAVLARLGQVLSSWNERAGGGSVPSKMVYLLNNKYSQGKLNATALTGADARTAQLINAAARRCGSRLGLATLVCKEEGLGLIGQRRDWVDDDWLSEKENIEGFDDLMDIETEIKLQQLVDFDGRSLNSSLEVDIEKEAIPADLESSVRSGQPDKRMIGFVDADELRLRQVYYRTVLVIWPQWSEVGHSGPEAHGAEPPAKRRRTED
ncbi:hypothetical protein K466DRAFT_665316 [Polyporus arcularius HHB13444]|uniref:Uncharacterized protein n=1 Tax=Polyporus arcularius HHB13444 TaxID=1314778 RepID=A0A5C3P3H3_9APHY|nr:hypothetical protein K466DRAFT_665316 [Polyporus arcularius HHB13444]